MHKYNIFAKCATSKRNLNSMQIRSAGQKIQHFLGYLRHSRQRRNLSLPDLGYDCYFLFFLTIFGPPVSKQCQIVCLSWLDYQVLVKAPYPIN